MEVSNPADVASYLGAVLVLVLPVLGRYAMRHFKAWLQREIGAPVRQVVAEVGPTPGEDATAPTLRDMVIEQGDRLTDLERRFGDHLNTYHR